MPIYRFHCSKCNEDYEDLVPKRGDISPCPKCGSSEVEKMISAPAKPVIKGSSDFSCADDSCDYGSSCGCGGGTCPHR